MSLLRQFANQTIIYGIGHILSRVLYFLVISFYLSHKLDDTYEFGLYGDMYAYSTLLIVLLSYRIDTAFFRFGSKEGMLNKVFSTAFIPLICTTLAAVVLIIFFKEPIATALHLEKYPHYFQWFALILAMDVLSLLPFAKLRLEGKAYRFMIYKVVNVLITIVLLIYFLEFYSGEGGVLHSLFPSQTLDVDFVFIANFFASASLLLFLLLELKGIKLSIDWSLWKKMVAYSLPLIIVGIANSVNQFFSTPLQHKFLGEDFDQNLTQAGVYAASMRLAVLLAMFNTAFNYAAEPFFFNNAEKTKDQTIYGKVITLYLVVGSIVIIGIVCSLDILQYLLGPEYRKALFVVPILLISYLFLGLYYNVSIWYKLADKTIFGSIIAVVGSMITLIVSVVFLPKIGYIASAWASLACYGSMVFLAYIIGKRYYPIWYPMKSIIEIICFTIAVILLVQMVDNYVLGESLTLVAKLLIMFSSIAFILFRNQSTLKELFLKTN